MNHAPSLALVGLAFVGLAACTPKPSEPDAAATSSQAINAVVSDTVPAPVDASTALTTGGSANGVAPPTDEPRGTPDRRAPESDVSIEAPK